MSSFKHNPYQQLSSRKPSTSQLSLVTRRVVLQQQQQHHRQDQEQQDAPQHNTHAAVTSTVRQDVALSIHLPYHSPPSRSTPMSPPSTNEFLLSPDVSKTGGDGLVHGDMDASLLSASPITGNTVRSLSQNVHVQPQQPQRQHQHQHHRPPVLGAHLPAAPPSSFATPQLSKTGLPQQHSETVSNSNPRSSISAFAVSHTEAARATDLNSVDVVDVVGRQHNASVSISTPVSTHLPLSSNTDSLSTTLFIDGLPSCIENQHQLSPYVPPHGRVAVRVKRVRNRDVGFAVYDSVDTASAALEWFHNIRMIKEMVQTSGYAGEPIYNVPQQQQLYLRPPLTAAAGSVSGGLRPCEEAMPVAYEDFLSVLHNPAQYAQLLRHSISLRVEWAHSHEAVHQLSTQQQREATFAMTMYGSDSYRADSGGGSNNSNSRSCLTDEAGLLCGPGIAASPMHSSTYPLQPPAVAGSTPYSSPPLLSSPCGGVAAPRKLAEDCAPAVPRSLIYTGGGSTHSVVSHSPYVSKIAPVPSCSSEARLAEVDQSYEFCRGAPTTAPSSSTLACMSSFSSSTANTTATHPSNTTSQFADLSLLPRSPTVQQQQQQQLTHSRLERRLPSRTLFVKLIHNFPLPPSLAKVGSFTEQHQQFGAETAVSSGPPTSLVHGLDAAGAITLEDRAFFALAQRVCREEFFSERFAGFVRYHSFLHPPYYGGCFVLFERDTDMQRCLQWMRGDARLMTLFAVQPARNDTFER